MNDGIDWENNDASKVPAKAAPDVNPGAADGSEAPRTGVNSSIELVLLLGCVSLLGSGIIAVKLINGKQRI
jgi:hypothetical protein